MRLAFFDLDRTLLAVNSATLWVRREVALGHISKRQAVRAMWWLARYQLGFASGEAVVAEAVTHLRGTPAQNLEQRTARFYETEVRHAFRPGALTQVARHRAAGDRLVMLTSSSNYLSQLAAAELGFDAVLCNVLEVGPDGLHTGRVDGRVCFGEGKLAHARLEADRAGGSLEAAIFYTDSYSDLPVMEAVGTAVAVNPDPRLKRHAARCGWAIVDWGAPLAQVA
ncbi:MAG: HAD family phosphatase [Myxococcaceae bacterium]|jgi:HAD superfamily hydrolase (TIGR01490 family)|nr:HAD family phosphatase [Myxococcaceae bacterium]MCA3013733.1 HAD family phosphatase [Myxococcaceae bacterium]